MPSIRDVHDTFEKLIRNQKKIVSSLQSEREAVRQQKSGTARQLRADIAAAIPDLTAPRLVLLTRIARQSGTPYDFTGAVAQMVETDSLIQNTQREEERVWGTPQHLKNKIREEQTAQNAADREDAESRRIVQTLDARMRPITTLNRNNTPKISRENRAQFESLKLWSFVSDTAYRQGYLALRAYAKTGHDYFADFDTHAEASVKNADAASRLQQHKSNLSDMENALNRAEKLQQTYKGPDAILQTVRDQVNRQLVDNPVFAANLARDLPENIGRPLVLGALKIRNLDKIEENLDRGIKDVLATVRNLEAPMSKLSKGKRYKPSKSVNVDLAKIEKGVNAQIAYSGYRAVSASRAREAVQTYQPSNSNDFLSFQNMFLIYMIMDMHTDAAYVNQTFGLDKDAAQSMNLNLEDLKPDLAGTLGDGIGNLSDQFNGLGDSIGQMDLGQIERDLANMGSIDVGSVDVGHIDTGSHNDFGGGGYDGGGGASFD